MGRSKKGKKRHGSHHPGRDQSNSQNWNKKPRKGKWQRFWIEDCPDTKVVPDRKYPLQVLITRVELTDDYTQQVKSTISTPHVRNLSDNEADKLPLSHDVETPNHEKESTFQDMRQPGNLETSERSNVDDNRIDRSQNELGSPSDQTDTSEVRRNNDTTTEGAFSKTDALHRDDSARNGDEESTKNQFTPSDAVSKPFVSIRRAESAKTPLKKFFENDQFEPLPNGDCGDGIKNPHSTSIVPDKFWSQRRRLFSRFDEGIHLDTEAWSTVTPQAIADHIASRVASSGNKLVVLDPFCGCGGNIIAFAKRNEVSLVIGVDTDIEKLKNAAINANIYGIPPEKLILIHDDACSVMSAYVDGKRVPSDEVTKLHSTGTGFENSKYRIGGLELIPENIDVIFLSPPWGGIDYVKVGKRNYSLSCIKLNGATVDGDQLLVLAAKALGNRPLVYFLPRNTNGSYLGQSFLKAGHDGILEMEQNILNGKLKTVTVYARLNSS